MNLLLPAFPVSKFCIPGTGFVFGFNLNKFPGFGCLIVFSGIHSLISGQSFEAILKQFKPLSGFTGNALTAARASLHRPFDIDFLPDKVSEKQFDQSAVHYTIGRYWLFSKSKRQLYPDDMDDLVVLVPSDLQQQRPTLMGDRLVLPSMCLAIVVVIVAFRLFVDRRLRSAQSLPDCGTCGHFCMDTVGRLLGNASGHPPDTRTDRTLCVALAFAAILLDMYLASYLLAQQYTWSEQPYEFDSVGAVVRAGMSFCAHKSDAGYIGELLARASGSLVVVDQERGISMLLNGDRFAYVLSRSFGKYVCNVLADAAEWQFHVMPERLAVRNQAMWIPRFSALEPRLNVLMRRLQEHGFMRYFEEHNARVQFVRQRSAESGRNVRNASGDHEAVMLWLWTWLTGCAVGLLVLCVERNVARLQWVFAVFGNLC